MVTFELEIYYKRGKLDLLSHEIEWQWFINILYRTVKFFLSQSPASWGYSTHRCAPVWQWGWSTTAMVQPGPQAEMKTYGNMVRHLQNSDCPCAFELNSSAFEGAGRPSLDFLAPQNRPVPQMKDSIGHRTRKLDSFVNTSINITLDSINSNLT